MGKLTKWKKEEWKLVSEDNSTDRPCVVIAIGEMEAQGQTTYIKEEIYRDILECALYSNNSFYKMHVSFNEVPKIVTYFNGSLVASNEHFTKHKRTIVEALKEIYAPDVFRAYIDLKKQNNQSDLKLSPAIEILRHRIKEITGEENAYQIMFLKPIVEEFITEGLIQHNEEELSQMEDPEFREVLIASLNKNRFQSASYNTLVKKHGEEEVKDYIQKEVIKRYLTGRVK